MRPLLAVRSLSVCALAVVASLGSAQLPASAGTPASVVLSDGSIRYVYGRRPTPVLVCAPHYVCDITLDSGENVLNMAIGDSAHWVIAGGQSGPGGTTPHVFVKPAQALLDTNLVITTSKRVYDIQLRSAGESKYSRISFLYADEDAAMRAAIAQRAVDGVLSGTPLVGADQADAKYTLSGEATLLPSRVYNDGVRTYIEWKVLPGELPQVVTVGKDGTSQPVNFRVVGTRYIVDNTDASFDLLLAASTDRHGRPERRALIRHQ